MASRESHDFASRAGEKLAHALASFGVSPQGRICADLGCSTGGFVDCLLRQGAAKVYAVDRGYGVLAYPLRNDPRVVVMERTDALHVHLPEPVRLVTIDTGWTRQCRILPVARGLLAADGIIISLIKPHYEATAAMLRGGVLPDELTDSVLAQVRADVEATGLQVLGEVESPIRGHAGNREVLWQLAPG
jgi:23S rRNA (cytidine1920-2'-O)/16S rRNA (cytidine1409-2'-O)-methyltransferase